MIDAKAVIGMYSITHRTIKLQTDGMTHEESLMQLPFGGNCMNWVLGHIMANRTNVETLMNLPAIWSYDEAQRYRRGSPPVTGEDGDEYPLDKILKDLDRSHAQIVEALQAMTPEDMEQVRGDSTLGERLAFFHFHETYHAGQLEIFRQMAGRDAKIK